MVYGGMCVYIYICIYKYILCIYNVCNHLYNIYIYIYVTHAQLDWFINPTGPSFGKWCKWLRHVTTLIKVKLKTCSLLLFAFCCIRFSFDVICILQLCSCHYSHMSQTCFRDGPCTFQKCWPHVWEMGHAPFINVGQKLHNIANDHVMILGRVRGARGEGGMSSGKGNDLAPWSFMGRTTDHFDPCFYWWKRCNGLLHISVNMQKMLTCKSCQDAGFLWCTTPNQGESVPKLKYPVLRVVYPIYH